jgi:osmotically-inducible protein OsmY
MRKMLTGICASALAISMGLTGLIPAQAAPVYVPTKAPEASSDVVKVQSREDYRRWRRHMRQDRREARRWDNDRRGYYRGYRGSRHYRHGWKRHGDYWFPAAAFVAGALVTGAIANSQPRVVYRNGNAHTQWCYDRYRSYRAYDNTFQPYNGPRQQCYSPYS